MDNLTLIILLANALILIVVSIVLALKQRSASHEVEESKRQIKALQGELNALYAGAAGVGAHLARIESQINELSSRQEQFDGRDSTTFNYANAIDMVHRGADVAELMDRCGLLREEAELLIQLHAPEGQEAAASRGN